MLSHTNRFPNLPGESSKLDSYTYIQVASMNVYTVRFTMPTSLKGGLEQSILHCHTYGAMLNTKNPFNLVTIKFRQVELLTHGHLPQPQGHVATGYSKLRQI
jgi:hypothetical protein